MAPPLHRQLDELWLIHLRVHWILAMSKKPVPGDLTWYVAFRQPNEAPGVYVRNTRTFQTEIDAKQFAQERFSEGCDVSAGTINPYNPKKTVGPLQIQNWLASGR